MYPHAVLPLRGRFKGEIGESFHFVSVTAKIKSGLVIGKWLERGITFRERRGVVRGYFFTNNKGGKMKSKELEVGIFDRIAVIKRRYPTLIRPRGGDS